MQGLDLEEPGEIRGQITRHRWTNSYHDHLECQMLHLLPRTWMKEHILPLRNTGSGLPSPWAGLQTKLKALDGLHSMAFCPWPREWVGDRGEKTVCHSVPRHASTVRRGGTASLHTLLKAAILGKTKACTKAFARQGAGASPFQSFLKDKQSKDASFSLKRGAVACS